MSRAVADRQLPLTAVCVFNQDNNTSSAASDERLRRSPQLEGHFRANLKI
ncbi:hypothetical protein HRbin17_00468 [bacterium HR17]|jgi:hypothetical protein|uniref:Uncharacterized protein n=1 Tax=Candidatus Fervidibacter japonicus TaxID=2035412 RepID=A0A2H5X9W3_9BACT|nr:hypothetical protein HRbin17_00468 [bacterium HR17]